MIGKKPLAVYCHETNPKGSWYRHGASANAIFEFDDGAVFTYRGSWCAEGANTSWESRWRIVGSKGTILWDGADEFQAGHRRLNRIGRCASAFQFPFRTLQMLRRPTGMPASSRPSSRRSRPARRPKRSAATTSTALPWFSARSKSAETGGASPFQIKELPVMSNPAKNIRIGTMISATDGDAPHASPRSPHLGFESFEPFFWQTTNGQDLAELGKRCRRGHR